MIVMWNLNPWKTWFNYGEYVYVQLYATVVVTDMLNVKQYDNFWKDLSQHCWSIINLFTVAFVH